jgi:hypothetical protein
MTWISFSSRRKKALEDALEQQRLSFLSSECQRLKERQETPRVQNATERKIEIVMDAGN